jgi:PilZ domain
MKMIKEKNIETVCRAENEHLGNGTNERRQHQRFTVENMSVDCDMSSTSKVKIMNISSSGVLVMADKLINIGKSYALKIGYKDKELFVKAHAVWALLADSVKEANGDIVPLYIAGMQFADVLRGEMKDIIQLLEGHPENTTSHTIKEMLQGNSYNEITVK